MREKETFWMALALLLGATTLAWSQEDLEGKYYESFENGIPPYFAATRPESLSLCPWHSKQGQFSLRWDWRRGEELVIRHGIGDVNRTGGFRCRASFAVWVYMEEPITDALLFEFREGEKVTGSFRFPLQFTGWRQGRPFYHDFPTGRPTSDVDNIRIVAPTQVEKGTVFFDLIKYNTLTYGGRAIVPEREAQWKPPTPDEQRFPKPERLTEADLAGLRKLLGEEEGTGVEEARVQELCRRVQALGIVRDEHGVRGGPGIDRHYQYLCARGEQGAKDIDYWLDEKGPNWLGMQTPGPITSLAYQVARAYRASTDADQKRRLADAFLLIEEYLYDQGMQAGAGFHWNWWVGGNWAEAVFLMRDVLAQAGRLQRQCDYYLWNYGGEPLFADVAPPSHMDYYHLYVPPLLRACLVQPEPAEQVRWLRAFKAMLERSITQPTSAFKVDGSAYHHANHYFAYATNAFDTLPRLMQRLGDTPWRLSAEAHERVRRAILAQRIYCNRFDLPLSLSGRRPFQDYQRINPRTFDLMARCGSPDGKHPVDPEVAAAYLRLVPEAANQEPYRSLGIRPEPDPNGCFVMPYAALLCHRRQDWLAAVHGQSKYLWGSERQDKVNCFGLFQGLGHLEILAGGNPVSAKGSGRESQGWDWRRFEGTTVPQLPLAVIDQGWPGTYSSETFVGGLSHQGQQGLFAMIVNQPIPNRKTLKGKESWFFYEDQIVCLGSDITCDEADYPTQTTLCQKRLPKNEKGEYLPTGLDGALFTAFPEARSLDPGKAHWFLDVQQTGYYLPAGQKVTVARWHQKSRDYWDQEDTEGDFLTAWIDHGTTPTASRYEYLLVVRATPERMQQIVANPPYQVVQSDHTAHVVWHKTGSLWACAFFVPQEVPPHAAGKEILPVKAVDRPCLILADAGRNGQLEISVADPDLNLEKVPADGNCPGVSRPRPLRVTLRGEWRLLDATGTVCAWPLPEAKENTRVVSQGNGETVVEILCQHGASYGLRLGRP